MAYTHASWLKPLFNANDLQDIARMLANEINEDKKNFRIDGIAIRGVSGSVIGGILSYLTDLPIVIVRKKETKRHSSLRVEYLDEDMRRKTYRYVIVDDLIASGKTVDIIVEDIGKEMRKKAILQKIYLYNDASRNTSSRYYLAGGKSVPVFSMVSA